MAKKAASKSSGGLKLDFKGGFFGLIKFVCFVFLIPVLAAVTIAFRKDVSELKTIYHHSFEWGIFTYVLLHLFLSDLVWFYKFGQGMAAELFKFWNPLATVAPYILPIYTTIIMGAYYLVVRVMDVGPNNGWWFFAIGFTLAMHLIMTARELYEGDTSTYKPNYLFEMSLVYILVILLMVQLLNFTAWKFSVIGFTQTVCDLTWNFYQLIYLKFF
jgi:hypothetical protein